MFGGNSNWRGPVWMPVTCCCTSPLASGCLLRRLVHHRVPDRLRKIHDIVPSSTRPCERLIGTFLKDDKGDGRCMASTEKFQNDPHWRDHIQFFEYFHGDNGAGIGASHQTGWTGCIATIIQINGLLTEDVLSKTGVEAEAMRLGANAQRLGMGDTVSTQVSIANRGDSNGNNWRLVLLVPTRAAPGSMHRSADPCQHTNADRRSRHLQQVPETTVFEPGACTVVLDVPAPAHTSNTLVHRQRRDTGGRVRGGRGGRLRQQPVVRAEQRGRAKLHQQHQRLVDDRRAPTESQRIG